jgi:outer membrane protein
MTFPYRLLICCALLALAHTSGASAQTAPPAPAPMAPAASSLAPPPGTPLSLDDAEKIALANHPQVQAAQSLAAAAQQQVREARSAYYPNAYGSLSGAISHDQARIGAGTFNDPRIFDKYANGVTVNQLVTDFGKTHEQVKSTSLRAQAQQENVVTTRADVLLAVDRAYFGALRAQAVLQVAQQTVQTRQLVSNQVTTMAQNELKSSLDVTFANVDLSQAQLLLIQAQNDLQVAYADLSTALGYSDQRTFQLTEQPMPPAPPPDSAALIQQAMSNRPEILSERLNVSSAESYAKAERDLRLPSITAVGAAGIIPYHDVENGLDTNYAAAGFNVNLPIFNGHLFSALHQEAQARAVAATQDLRDLTDRISRDVRAAWLNLNSAYQRLSVTEQLLSQATLSLNLAQSRYNLGLSSIIELSQAQLNLTQAQITNANAKYDYQTQQSVLNYEIGLLH